jgi:hypothetical protein
MGAQAGVTGPGDHHAEPEPAERRLAADLKIAPDCLAQSDSPPLIAARADPDGSAANRRAHSGLYRI